MPDATRPPTRLYLITPPRIEDAGAFSLDFQKALSGGDVACLQIRCKPEGVIDEAMTRAVFDAVSTTARAHDVALIINDSPELCEELGADGVHLGADDMTVKEARKRLGDEAVIGATCKASRHRAMQAGEQGADYVAFGAFYPTSTKSDATPADADILSWWQEVMELPCVAIGGITPNRAEALSLAGADFLAVCNGVWAHPDGPAAAVDGFNRAFAAAAASWR